MQTEGREERFFFFLTFLAYSLYYLSLSPSDMPRTLSRFIMLNWQLSLKAGVGRGGDENQGTPLEIASVISLISSSK